MSSQTQQIELARRLAENIRRVRREVEQIQVVADSPDGLVRVSLGGRGQVLDLDLDPRIFRDPDSRALADAITGTIQDAQDGVNREVSRLSKELACRSH